MLSLDFCRPHYCDPRENYSDDCRIPNTKLRREMPDIGD
jgi:hypothetical protein